MVLGVGYAVLLRLFGGFVASVIYLGVSLLAINPGRHLQNTILSVTIPAAIFLLFDRLLNANMPPALFELPF
jgi:putative tricarboxylic transport membrane protein